MGLPVRNKTLHHLLSADDQVITAQDKDDEESSSLVFSPKAGFGRNQSPVRRPVWLWHTAF